jgi:hypothetical protein
MCDYFIHRCAAIFLHDGFNCCNGLWCHYSVCLTRSRRVCYRTNAIHELLSPLYTCCSDRHAPPYWTFIRWWILMGYAPSLLKNRWQNTSSLVHAASGAAIFTLLLHHCVAFLHRTATCWSLFKPYHCCQLTRQLSCVLNFYHTFKVLIWLSLLWKRTPLKFKPEVLSLEPSCLVTGNTVPCSYQNTRL